MVTLLTILGVLLLAAAWLYVYTLLGIIPKGTWGRLQDRLFGSEHTKRYEEDVSAVDGERGREREVEEEEEEEEVFHDVFDVMDKMNVSEVESFKAYGHRTFYFTCSKCKQKNRLGTDLAKFKKAGCGKCHAKFFGGSSEDVGAQSTNGDSSKDKRAN